MSRLTLVALKANDDLAKATFCSEIAKAKNMPAFGVRWSALLCGGNILMYINEKIKSLVSTSDNDDCNTYTINVKRRFVEDNNWSYLEKGINKFLNTLYEQGQLSIKPTDIIVGYEKNDGKFGDDFTIFMLFDN